MSQINKRFIMNMLVDIHTCQFISYIWMTGRSLILIISCKNNLQMKDREIEQI